jgi:hypothetical protein
LGVHVALFLWNNRTDLHWTTSRAGRFLSSC